MFARRSCNLGQTLLQMKLKYKIAKSTELSSETIIKNILLKLETEKYGVLDITDSSVSFDDDDGRMFVGNWEYARRFKSGSFTIIKNNESNIVTLDYYPIPISDFIWVGICCAIPTIFGIVNNAYFVGFLSWLFIGQLIFKHYNLKNKATEMLSEVSS
jgi:hypothetical protein